MRIMGRVISNFGSDFNVWIAFLIIAIVAYALVGFVQTLRKLRDVCEIPVDTKLKRKAMVKALIAGVGVVALIVFFYFGFGPGKPVRVIPASEDGMRQLVEEMPDEMPEEVIKQEAYQKKPESLKAQDRGFEKEAKEADDYVSKAVEKAEKTEKAEKGE